MRIAWNSPMKFPGMKNLFRLIIILPGMAINFSAIAHPAKDTVRAPINVHAPASQDHGRSKWEILVLVGVLGFIGLKNRGSQAC
jgi:hypothetical protein